MRSGRAGATRSHRLLVVVLTVAGLVAAALPVSARPYGAAGRPGEVRYGAAASTAQYRCESMLDNLGRRQPLCVHWVTSGRHKPVNADWVRATRIAFRTSWNTIVRGGGYRRPLADGGKAAGHGPNIGLDVYIADIDADGSFGYCTHDRGHNVGGEQPIPAYCVVDNDLARVGVETAARPRELRGTAAHEFFHAVQYAYDPSTPDWFSEGTSVAMENLVFPGGNTEHRYLDITALRQPEDPFDRTGPTGYGSWLFWQYLAEANYASNLGPSVWRRVANGTGTEGDIFTALGTETRARLGYMLPNFGAWNYAIDADWSYAEGAAYLNELGSRPPLAASHTLTARRTSTDMTGSTAAREITAEPRSIHYVRIKSDVQQTIEVTVNQPQNSAYLVQTGTGLDATFGEPVHIGAVPASIPLAAGQSVLLVLTNPINGQRTLTYRAVAQP